MQFSLRYTIYSIFKKTMMRNRLKTLKGVEEDDEDPYECCAQWSLLLTNLPVLLIGAALVALGSWALSERDFLEALELDGAALYVGLAAAVVTVGCVLVLLSVFGAVAAFSENRKALLGYYVTLVVVFLVLCVVVLLGYVFRMKARIVDLR